MSAARITRGGEFCFIYIIGGETGPLKIGITSHVESRLSSLQTSTHQKLYLIEHFKFPTGLAKIIERATHAALAKNRLRGEWFSVDPGKAMQTVRQVASEADAIWSAKPKTRVEAKTKAAEVKKEPPAVVPRIFVVDSPVVSKIPIDDYIDISDKIQKQKKAVQWQKDAPKRALVALLSEGKKRKAEARKADALAKNAAESESIAKLQAWLSTQKPHPE